jgi:hypothetical protein
VFNINQGTKFVVDDPDVSSLDAEESDAVHAHADDGCWHRLKPNHMHLACGPEVNHARVTLRPAELAGNLCPQCFTPSELQDAVAADREKFADLPARDFRAWLDSPANGTNGTNRKRKK